MAQALRKISERDLEDNGVVRGAVFPNAVRDVRRDRGFPTLRDFDGKVSVTYTRLAKIERGEIFPSAQELNQIAKALEVPVGKLLVDISDPEFDREQWARDHIEAKLKFRGGGIEAMRLGAALRVKRLEMKRSTTDMKEFGLPAATVSRIENADRPLERWDRIVQRGIAKVFGVRSSQSVQNEVMRMREAGELDDMLMSLFSPEAIEERNTRRLRNLLTDLPGQTAKILLDKLPGATEPEVHGAPVSATIDVLGVAGEYGLISLVETGRSVVRPEGLDADVVAIQVTQPVLGPGLPTGSVLIVDPGMQPSAGDVAVVINMSDASARLLSVLEGRDGLEGFSMASDKVFSLEALGEGEIVGKVVSVIH